MLRLVTLLLLVPALARGAQQKPERSQGPALPVLKVQGRKVFHGSSVPGIKRLRQGESETVGQGIYFATGRNQAEAYARYRSQRAGTPTVYATRLHDLRLADLRSESAVADAARGFAAHLTTELEAGVPFFEAHAIRETIARIPHAGYASQSGRLELMVVTYGQAPRFTSYLRAQGFDGLITFKGPERKGREAIGNHDMILVFDPGKLGSLKEFPATPAPSATRR